MLRLCKVLTVLILWLMCTGTHWDLLQTIAWTRMLAMNTEVMPIKDAIKQTFDLNEKCGLCHVVMEGKKKENKDWPLTNLLVSKPLLYFRFCETFILPCAETSSPWVQKNSPSLDCRKSTPPTPPPRVKVV